MFVDSKKPVWLAVIIVVVYITLNLVVVGNWLLFVVQHPETITYWRNGLFAQQPNYLMAFAAALLVFPRLSSGCRDLKLVSP